jgi:hypothetical protein
MFVLGIMALGDIGGGERPLLLVLLVLAILLLLAGALLAVVALRNQRRDVPQVGALEQVENEAS